MPSGRNSLKRKQVVLYMLWEFTTSAVLVRNEQARKTAYSDDVVFTKAKLVVVVSLKVQQCLCSPPPVTCNVDVIIEISRVTFHWVICLYVLHGANKNKMVLNVCLCSMDHPLCSNIALSELNNSSYYTILTCPVDQHVQPEARFYSVRWQVFYAPIVVPIPQWSGPRSQWVSSGGFNRPTTSSQGLNHDWSAELRCRGTISVEQSSCCSTETRDGSAHFQEANEGLSVPDMMCWRTEGTFTTPGAVVTFSWFWHRI